MSNIVSDNIARMVHLYSYKSDTSTSNKPQSVVEYHKVAPDGKTYGILKEGTKYYIKVAPVKDTKVLAEDYDYIGGITNKKRYEYDSYANAYKQFDLKMMSINEAFNNVYDDVEYSDSKHEQAEWQIKETKEMRAEIDRYRQIVENVDKVLTEGTNAKRPKVGKGVGEIGKHGDCEPFCKKASGEMNQKTGSCKNAKCADDTFDENPMSTEKVNKMGEHENFNGNDKTYSKKAKIDKKRMNEQTALSVNDNPNYMDMSHGTKKGSSAPYCCGDDECSCDDLFEDAFFDDDNLNNPKPGTGCGKCKTKPFNKRVNEDTMLPDEAAGFESDGDDELNQDYNDEAPFGYEDDELSNEGEDTDEYGESGDEYSENDGDIDDFDISIDDEEDEYDYDDLDDAERELEDGENNFDDAERDLEDSERDLDDAERDLDDAERDFEVGEYKEGNDEFEDAENDFESAEDDFESAEGEFDDAEREFDDAEPDFMNEGVIDYFGKHPAYRKSPFTLPDDKEIDRWGRDWNDDSAKGGEYGRSKGKSSPYDEELLIDNIVKHFLKKKVR